MSTASILVIIIIVVALAFDFINGFHDAANSIATVVSTRVLSPKLAVVWAAFFNFAAAFFLGTAVAKTMGKGLVHIEQVTPYVILAGLLGAITWDLITWYWGLPTSSSHALMGGYAGAAIAKAGWSVIILPGWYQPVLYIFLSPLIGLVLGLGMMVAVSWLFEKRAPRQVDKWFRKLQLLSAAAFSYGHGGSDAQKTMGIIAGALFTGGFITKQEMNGSWGIYHWYIILAANGAIAMGTYFGGWRIVHTMGSKITKLKPVGGFCAETAGSDHSDSDGACRHPGKHHAHHYGRHRWGGFHAAVVGSTLGSSQTNCMGVAADDSRGRGCGRAGLLDHSPGAPRRLIVD